MYLKKMVTPASEHKPCIQVQVSLVHEILYGQHFLRQRKCYFGSRTFLRNDLFNNMTNTKSYHGVNIASFRGVTTDIDTIYNSVHIAILTFRISTSRNMRLHPVAILAVLAALARAKVSGRRFTL